MTLSSSLKIAVDARPLCHPGTGIYRYTRELLARMCDMGGRWYLYSPQPYDTGKFSGPNIIHRMSRVPNFLGGSQASQILFPYWARRDGVDLFWGPRHHLPLLLPAGVRSVLTVHDLVWQKHGASMRVSRRLSEQLSMPASLKRADKIVSGSQYIASQLVESYPSVRSRLAVIPYASGVAPLELAGGAPDTDSNYFLFVGTMEPRKNLPRLLAAYKVYAVRCGTAKKLIIVGGEGWGAIDPVKLVAIHGLEGMVEVKGKVSDTELSALYAGAYALIMPSIYEGFGLPVVEALAHGVPAIVSRASALSEVAAAAGYTVDPMSEESICEALCTMTTERDTYSRLRSSAPLRALDYSWDRSAAVMYKLLSDWR